MNFDVYLMEMLPSENCGWVENNRTRVGHIAVPAKTVDEIGDKMLLDAMFRLKLRNKNGLTEPAICTTDRRRVYAEDYYGDGGWFEIGAKAGHKPIYGLKPYENAR